MENVRFVQLALHQGKIKKSKAAVTVVNTVNHLTLLLSSVFVVVILQYLLVVILQYLLVAILLAGQLQCMYWVFYQRFYLGLGTRQN